MCHVIITWCVDISIKRFSKEQWSFWCIVCAYSMHGSGDNQPNVQKSKIQSYSVEHCTRNEELDLFNQRVLKFLFKQRKHSHQPLYFSFVSLFLLDLVTRTLRQWWVWTYHNLHICGGPGVEIEGYSVAYFDRITVFEVPYCWTSVKSGAHTRFVDAWISNESTKCVWAPPLTEVQRYGASNAAMRSKYATE